MKKILALVLALVLCLAATSALAEKIGTSAVTKVEAAKNASADGDGQYEVDTTVCTLILNDDGTIKYVKFDVAQSRLGWTAEGAATTEAGTAIPSKWVKQEAYGMARVSKLEKGEWFQQITAFEEYCVGKTVEEVVNMPLRTISEGHDTSPDVEELLSTCTMTVGDFLEALQAAADLAK